MDAQQNVFNVGFDLATVLAIAGVGQGGDLLETKKLSIGCDASSRTSGIIGGLLGDELGLNGHNHFESDTSLTRNDYYLSPTRDNYSFNSTLFTSMMAACDGECDRSKLSVYRKQRYEESKRDNGQFFFGTPALPPNQPKTKNKILTPPLLQAPSKSPSMPPQPSSTTSSAQAPPPLKQP